MNLQSAVAKLRVARNKTVLGILSSKGGMSDMSSVNLDRSISTRARVKDREQGKCVIDNQNKSHIDNYRKKNQKQNTVSQIDRVNRLKKDNSTFQGNYRHGRLNGNQKGSITNDRSNLGSNTRNVLQNKSILSDGGGAINSSSMYENSRKAQDYSSIGTKL